MQSPLYPGLSVISAPYEGGIVRTAPLSRLAAAMTPYFDFILFDTAAGMGPAFEAGAEICSRALVVLTPDPVALRDGRIVADRLIADGHPQEALRLVVNRVTPDSFGKHAPVFDLDECIDTVGIQLLGVLPESREAAAQRHAGGGAAGGLHGIHGGRRHGRTAAGAAGTTADLTVDRGQTNLLERIITLTDIAGRVRPPGGSGVLNDDCVGRT